MISKSGGGSTNHLNDHTGSPFITFNKAPYPREYVDRIRGLILICVLVAIGLILNHFLFPSHSTSQNTHKIHINITVSSPRCIVTKVLVDNVSIPSFFVNSITLNPYTPFIKSFLALRPSQIVVKLLGVNASEIKVFIALENNGNLSILSPEIYREESSYIVYEAIVPPGLVSVVVMNVLEKPLSVGIEVYVQPMRFNP